MGATCVGDMCVGDTCVGDMCVGATCVGAMCVGATCVGATCVGDMCVGATCGSNVGTMCGSHQVGAPCEVSHPRGAPQPQPANSSPSPLPGGRHPAGTEMPRGPSRLLSHEQPCCPSGNPRRAPQPSSTARKETECEHQRHDPVIAAHSQGRGKRNPAWKKSRDSIHTRVSREPGIKSYSRWSRQVLFPSIAAAAPGASGAPLAVLRAFSVLCAQGSLGTQAHWRNPSGSGP